MTENLHVPGAKADSGKPTLRLLAEDFPHAISFFYSMPIASGMEPAGMLRMLMLAPVDGTPVSVSVKKLLSALTYSNPHLPQQEAQAKALYAAADVAGFGMRKYTASGWKHVENGVVRYTEALYRHLASMASGETHDVDSGRPHTSHAIWNCLAVLELLDQVEEPAARLY